MLITTNQSYAQKKGVTKFKWSTLSPIPDPIGFAGSFAGVSNGMLLVVGGANFPDGGAPWTGSTKAWTDQIFALDNINGQWKAVGKLPHALGYGGSVTYKNDLILLGGSNEKGHHANVYQLSYTNGKVGIKNLPDLPYPIANTTAVLCGDIIYIAGGLRNANSKTTENNFWALDLAAKERSWKTLPSWPGASRMLHVLGATTKGIYLFSGVELVDGNRKYLTDAFQYTQQGGWQKIADLPVSVAAAPSPAYTGANGQLIIFGGDDGLQAANAAILKEKHPGFADQVLAYDPFTNQWKNHSKIYTHRLADAVSHPNNSIWAVVTTTLTVFNGNIIIAGGEVRPATRTPNVLMAHPLTNK